MNKKWPLPDLHADSPGEEKATQEKPAGPARRNSEPKISTDFPADVFKSG